GRASAFEIGRRPTPTARGSDVAGRQRPPPEQPPGPCGPPFLPVRAPRVRPLAARNADRQGPAWEPPGRACADEATPPAATGASFVATTDIRPPLPKARWAKVIGRNADSRMGFRIERSRVTG